MKEIFILGGANGSGKSTFAVDLIEQTNYFFLNADEIEKELDEPKTNAASVKAGRMFFDKIYELIKDEVSFIVESTLSGKSLLNIVKKAKENNYNISIIYVYLDSAETCIKRIKARVQKGGHFIPDDIVRRRYYRSLHNFWYRYKDLADDWKMYYNASVVIEAVATGGGIDDASVTNWEYFEIFNQNLDKYERD